MVQYPIVDLLSVFEAAQSKYRPLPLNDYMLNKKALVPVTSSDTLQSCMQHLIVLSLVHAELAY